MAEKAEGSEYKASLEVDQHKNTIPDTKRDLTETEEDADDGFEDEDDDDEEDEEDTDWIDIDDMIDMDDSSTKPVSETMYPKLNHTLPVAHTIPEAAVPADKTPNKQPAVKKQKMLADLKDIAGKQWDPFHSIDWDKEPASVRCISRLKRDFTEIFSEAPPMINVVPDENDITKIHALINGPASTPYEGGFFYFFLRAPPQYPIEPPRVRLVTTGSNTVRFNPNLYRDGKVCLSILGTWRGPPWSAAQSLLSLLLSIQSLMCEKPFYNEPGFDKPGLEEQSDRYNECIAYKTLCAAACEMVESLPSVASIVPKKPSPCSIYNMPKALQERVKEGFLANNQLYKTLIAKYKHLEGKNLNDPHHRENKGVFEYAELEQRIENLYRKLAEKQGGTE